MTTQEINRYITVASNWEHKYSNLAKRHDAVQKILFETSDNLYTSEILVKNQKNAINKLKNQRRYLACALFGFFIGQIIMVAI